MFSSLTFLSSIDAILLVTALSMDAFVASFAYGTSKIKIPFKSAIIINLVCSTILGIALFAGNIISNFIPPVFTTSLCVTMLLMLGLAKLFDSTLKAILSKSCSLSRNLSFKLFDFKFFLTVCLDGTAADRDHSYELSPKESFSLAVALSLDGLAAGFSTGLMAVNIGQIIIFSLIINMIAILVGCFIGNKVAERTDLNLSWLSGATLILLAFLKLR
ncbi:MAG: sporulation membrane protein YtaF [Terrisporobacter sp.]|uniref:sporulation membrane protein YtaF n=1 Tax=Terrisporobacter sp. TaxID=1965305 RepID=UPI002FCA1323